MVYYLLVALYLLICLLLLLVVLMQQGRGGDMASAFGGGGSSQTAFGARTGAIAGMRSLAHSAPYPASSPSTAAAIPLLS